MTQTTKEDERIREAMGWDEHTTIGANAYILYRAGRLDGALDLFDDKDGLITELATKLKAEPPLTRELRMLVAGFLVGQQSRVEALLGRKQ